MTKLRRLVAICLLVAATSAVTFADGDGGVMQGPPTPPPPPAAECIGCPEPAAAEPAQSQDWSVDILTVADTFASWFAMSIL